VAYNELIVIFRALTNSFQTIQVDQQTMQVDHQRNIQFLETVEDQQEQLQQHAQWSEALQAARTSAARGEAVLRPPHAHFECPVKLQTPLEAIAFPRILQFSKTATMMNYSWAFP
jgi:hypothetical protein